MGVWVILESVESVGTAMTTGMKQQNIIHLEGIGCGHCVIDIYELKKVNKNIYIHRALGHKNESACFASRQK